LKALSVGGSFDLAPLNHPPKTWTASRHNHAVQSAGGATFSYSIFLRMSSSYSRLVTKKFKNPPTSLSLKPNVPLVIPSALRLHCRPRFGSQGDEFHAAFSLFSADLA
jgi:hypothetical protein